MKVLWKAVTTSAIQKCHLSANGVAPSGAIFTMAKDIEYDPVNGSWTEIDDDLQTGDLIIKTKQDPTPALDWAKKQRNSGVNDLGGRRDKGDLKHYATISLAQIMAMRNKGIDVWNKDHTKDMIKEIERNYPLCKVTNRKILG